MKLKLAQSERQLHRLERLMDVVFGLLIWRAFMLLPRPDFDSPEWDTVAEMFISEWLGFVVPTLVLVIVTIFWVQNNSIFSKLRATDAIHTGISILQVFLLLFYLYSVRLGVGVGSASDTRVLESTAAALVGAASLLGWWYASRVGKLVAEEITEEEVKRTGQASIAEPLTALLTIPAAFFGPGVWEVSWFFYPLLKKILGRRHTQAS